MSQRSSVIPFFSFWQYFVWLVLVPVKFSLALSISVFLVFLRICFLIGFCLSPRLRPFFVLHGRIFLSHPGIVGRPDDNTMCE